MIKANLNKRTEEGHVLLPPDTPIFQSFQMIVGEDATAICSWVVEEDGHKIAGVDWSSLRPGSLNNWYLEGILEHACARAYGTEDQYEAVCDCLDVFWYDVVLDRSDDEDPGRYWGKLVELFYQDQSYYRPDQATYPKAPERIRICELMKMPENN